MNDFRIAFEPQLTLVAATVLGLAAIGQWLLVRNFVGTPNAVSQRWGLLGLRLVTVGLLASLLINPVVVQETIGAKHVADAFYLLDASQSMAVGDDGTRWEQALSMIRESRAEGDIPLAKISLFRFGQRLDAVPLSLWERPADDFKPTDADTQLASALRQLTSRFGRTPPASIVVLSDGRIRDAAEIEKVGQHFAKMKVPIHVVPVGEAGKGGDLAIVGVVSPNKVRKNSQVDVRVFLRSYGYDDQRSELTVTTIDRTGKRRIMNRFPITVRSGIQSFSTHYQSGEQRQKVEVAITSLPGELSLENNRYHFDVTIDRTKIRVLYVEGGPQAAFSFNADPKSSVARGPHADLQQALTADADIECVVLAPQAGNRKLHRVNDGQGMSGVRGFPETIAELAAYDALIISNTARRYFTDVQLDWIEQWIDKRGGGLCMIGGPNSFTSGGWKDDLLDRMLPVEPGPDTSDWDPTRRVKAVPTAASLTHPIWHIVDDETANREILRSLPDFTGLHRVERVKTDANAMVLASSDDQGTNSPVLTIGSYGKGRTMAISVPVTAPWANGFVNDWGEADHRYYAKFWRNAVYWLTEDSSIGRRRLVAKADQPFYRPTEKIMLSGAAYDESANRTSAYRLVAMIEPQGNLNEVDPVSSPIRWPDSLQRTSGETGPYIAWGEEFELPHVKGQLDYNLQLVLGPAPAAASATQSIRLELTAYEETTQIDSTSLDLRIVHDPYEQQNPFPDHESLFKLATASGGKVLQDATAIREMLRGLPVPPRVPVVRKSPWWSQWWILSTILSLMTVEWFWRRRLGLG